MRYLKILGIYEHDFNFFFEKKVCAHKRHRCKNFPYFYQIFFKNVPDVMHTFMASKSLVRHDF